ncbi:MAG: CoB--CoM heterodisulfide reductase iron-sulfur subunit B family protein [Bacteroidales bacterium]|nr:MAG: CoB--CoM heterodisulfide reductase iron-sulfur subunit B family protein [Bacteroidales bacterium]
MKYLYYPGCSQKSSAISYERSFLAICDVLGIELIELDDWNCCGATIAISVNKMVSFLLAARNLGLANKYNLPLVTPCPSCYVSLNRILKVCKESKSQSDQINTLLAEEDLTFSTDTQVYHSLEFLVHIIGLDTIRERIRNPLRGFKIAPYYGCQLVGSYVNPDNNGNPQSLEELIEVLGAEPVKFPFRTQCCGGSLMFTLSKQAEKLSGMILQSICRTDADLIVTPCGLCQMNLEIAQKKNHGKIPRQRPLPVITFGQMMGLAFDLDSGTIGINKKKILAKQNIISLTN